MRWAGWLLLCLSYGFAQPGEIDTVLRRAIAAQERRDFAAAARDYRLVLEQRPELTTARLNLAAALAELGRLDEAISVLKPASDQPGVRRNLAVAYYRSNQLAAAVAELQKLTPAERAQPEIASMLADCYIRSGTPAKAVEVIEPVMKAHPTDARLLYQLGMARVRAGKPNEALDPLERAGKRGASAEAYLLAGATALDLGQFQRARDDLEAAVRLDPKIPGAWTWAGMARDRVSDEEGAKQAYRLALEADPRDFEANLHLGAILYRERDFKAAKPFLERALAIQPASTVALYAMALVRASTGEMEESVRDLASVIAAEPEWLEPHVKLASLYFRLHREADGRREQEIVEKLRGEGRQKTVPLPDMR